MRALLAVTGLLSLVGAGSSGSGVQVLWTSPRPITAFAQDGQLLSWFTAGERSCNTVHVLSLGGVRAALPKETSGTVTCRWNTAGAPPRLAVAARTGAALWTLHETATTEFDYVVGAAVTAPSERRFSQLAHATTGAGLWLGDVAGSGRTLVYSVATVAYVDQLSCLAGGSCAKRIRGGGIHRIVGRGDPLVPHTGPALEVAAAAGRVAYVPAVTVDGRGRPQPSPARALLVRTARTGTLVSRARPGGTPLALALAPHVLAALVESHGRKRVVWFDAEDGTRLGSIRVPAGTAPELAANDQVVVFRVGRVVRAADVDTRKVRTLVKTSSRPIGLSLAGSRLAWAENRRGGKAEIRAIFLRGRG
ncbi:MAG TPA: hypothetical protein VFJ91_11360 [Gaiellaceae bacterium]|nr:hypothetical protein [Gaiellaceae bacterium]